MATQTTGGGSTTSFNNTPQAQGDTYGWTEEQLLASGIYDAATCTIALNVMSNDLGGKAKTLWSIDDGGSNFMSELLQSNITTGWEKTAEGNWIRIYNGKIEFRIDSGSNSPENARSVDSLSGGESIQDSFYYSIRLSNGTLSYAKVTLDIVGQNDAAAISGTSTGSVIEAGGTSNGDPGSATAAGTLNVCDVDTGQKHFQTPQKNALDGTYGRFSFDATTGAWTYVLDNACAATQALTAGQMVTETLTVWSADGTASREVVVTIHGTNDAPAVSAAVSGSASEDEAGFSVDLLAGASDADASDVLNVSGLTLTGGDASGVTVNGDGLSVDPSVYNYLAVGETAVITYSYDVIDSHGGSVAQTATITIEGRNDQPAVSAAVSGSASEDEAGFSVDLLAGASDADASDVLHVSGLTLTGGDASGVTVNGDGLSVDPSAYNYLAVGETAVITYSYDVIDGHGGAVAQTATITIEGRNDQPAVSAAVSGSASEDEAGFSVDLLAGASDADASDVLHVSGLTLTGGDASGVTVNGYGLSVDPSAYNYLAVGETAVITYSYDVIDGHGGSVAQTATITIEGRNDQPAVSAAVSGSASEDEAGFSVDLLAGASDADASDVLNVSGLTLTGGDASGVTVNGDGLSVDPSVYNYLAVGETAVITYSYDVIDSHGGSVAQTATITIEGRNDQPAVSAAVSGSASEDEAGFSVDLLAGASDADASDVLNVSGLTLTGGDASGVTVNGDGLSVDPSAYNYLAVGETAVITYSYDVIDSHGGSVAQTATITIEGRNDQPAVSAAVSGSASEDEAGFSVDLLAGASDADASDVLNVSGLTLTGGDASGVTVNGDGLSVDPSAYNYLAVGETAVITYSYDVIDGHGGAVAQTATITIEGRNGQPAVSAAVSGSASEDEAGFSVDLLAGASDADASDVLNVSGLTLTGGDASGVTVNGDGLSVDPSAYNYLAVGETAVITYSYDVIDGHGGSVAQTATITIEGANDAPVNTIPCSQTVGSNIATAITGVAVADVDTANVTTTLSVSSGKLTVGTGGGFTLNNNGTNTVTISGTLAQVNAALATLCYLSNTNYSGADTLTVVTSDGLASDTDTVAITVNPPANVAPAASDDAIVISTGTSVFLSAAWLLNNDADTDGDALSISASSIIGSLPSGWTITPVTAGGAVTGFNVSTGNVNQAATLSYTVDDGQGHTSTAQFTIRTPSTPSNNVENEIDLASLNYNYSYIDGKAQGDELRANLTLTGTQGNDVFVGGSGEDVLDAGAGNNILTGGGGFDTFVFRNFASTTNHVTDFNPGANSTSVDKLGFEVGIAANEFSAGNNDTVFIFKTGNDAAINVASTEVAVKTDASVTNATVQNTINGYSNIATGAFFVFHNTDLGHAAVYYDPNPAVAGGAVLVADLDTVTTLGNLTAFNAGDFLFV
ncbi:cadherin-like domain-containing protein [Sinorhizobium sp. CCBAU 05631]|uniref:beta strand repeat-containing protein n=3 Tax=Sinorhizobium sp. CCBAU 05631 TaxID=794846 RepID=UPI000BAC9B74|nr:cadherin-like domain-containing protein [Sinorhizobium sp. CCBAU 05631]ASY57959.1 Alkaline phosphatase [Sinorhizobium sp. CCBAU 05631]